MNARKSVSPGAAQVARRRRHPVGRASAAAASRRRGPGRTRARGAARSTSSPSKTHRVGRHRDADVLRRDRHRGGRVAALVRVDEAREQLALLRASARPPTSRERRAGRCSCIVARARWRALFAAATLVSSSAGRLLGRPAQHVARDQRRPLPRRQHLERGEERQLDRLALDRRPRRARRRRPRPRRAARSGYGCSHGTSANEPVASSGRAWRRQRVEADVRRDPVQPGPDGRAARRSRRAPRHARRNVSCTASSASSNEASIR